MYLNDQISTSVFISTISPGLTKYSYLKTKKYSECPTIKSEQHHRYYERTLTTCIHLSRLIGSTAAYFSVGDTGLRSILGKKPLFLNADFYYA